MTPDRKGDCLQRVSGGNPTGHAGRRKMSYSTSTSRGDVRSSSKVARVRDVCWKRPGQVDHYTASIILQRDSMRRRIFPQSGYVQRHNLLGLGPASIRPSPPLTQSRCPHQGRLHAEPRVIVSSGNSGFRHKIFSVQSIARWVWF